MARGTSQCRLARSPGRLIVRKRGVARDAIVAGMTLPLRGECSRRRLLGQALAAGAWVVLPVPAGAAPAAPLPTPVTRGGMALTEALARRRSVRRFDARAVTLAGLAQLLWATQGRSAPGRRTAPSAGALYPLELHVAALRVEQLAPGTYRYLGEPHALQHRAEVAMTPASLQAAAFGQPAVGTAALVVAITAVEARSAVKYGARAAPYAAFEAGAAAQNLALQAVALGLGSVVVGGFDDAAVARVLALPADERPLALLPIGQEA